MGSLPLLSIVLAAVLPSDKCGHVLKICGCFTAARGRTGVPERVPSENIAYRSVVVLPAASARGGRPDEGGGLLLVLVPALLLQVPDVFAGVPVSLEKCYTACYLTIACITICLIF